MQLADPGSCRRLGTDARIFKSYSNISRRYSFSGRRRASKASVVTLLISESADSVFRICLVGLPMYIHAHSARLLAFMFRKNVHQFYTADRLIAYEQDITMYPSLKDSRTVLAINKICIFLMGVCYSYWLSLSILGSSCSAGSRGPRMRRHALRELR